MAIRTYDITLGAGATPVIANPVTGHKTPFQELHITNVNTGAGHTIDVGLANVATVPGIRIPIATTDVPVIRIIGNGPGGLSVEVLENIYLKGTQNDHVYLLVVTL